MDVVNFMIYHRYEAVPTGDIYPGTLTIFDNH